MPTTRKRSTAGDDSRAGLPDEDTTTEAVARAASGLRHAGPVARGRRELEARLRTARKAESRRFRQLAKAQAKRGRKAVSKRARQAEAAAATVVDLAGQLAALLVEARPAVTDPTSAAATASDATKTPSAKGRSAKTSTPKHRIAKAATRGAGTSTRADQTDARASRPG